MNDIANDKKVHIIVKDSLAHKLDVHQLDALLVEKAFHRS